MFECLNCAGLTLRATESNGVWTVREVRTASCPIGDEPVLLPDDVQPGDIVECHSARHRVTYEFGSYALVPRGQIGRVGPPGATAPSR